MGDLTHIDDAGNSRMVEVGPKPITNREALAEGFIELSPKAMGHLKSGTIAKGDVLAVAQLAGIQGAKRTSDLIPLCHPIPLTGVEVLFERTPEGVWARATARAQWRTGVEMEALTAVSTALLTIYDMVKAVDKEMTIRSVRLLKKTGGRSGEWHRTSVDGVGDGATP